MTSRWSRLPAWVDAAVIACLTAAVYAQVIRHDFITFDDSLYVTANERVLGGFNWNTFWWAWSNFDAANYHPLTWLSYLLDIECFGPNAGWMAAENAALHAINGCLVAAVLRELGCSRVASLLAALVFAAHPLNVESVAWVSQRKTVLASLFGLTAILVYLRRSHRGAPPAGWLVTGLLAASLLTKAWFVVLPGLLLAVDVFILNRLSVLDSAKPLRSLLMGAWPFVREKLPMIAIVLGIAVATVLSQGSKDAIATTAVVPVQLRFGNAATSSLAYLSDVFRSDGFSLFYSLPESIPAVHLLGAIGALTAITLATVAWRRNHPQLLVGWTWYLLFLLPVIGLIQVGGQSRADRYMYIPLIGVLWVMAHVGDRVWKTMKSPLRIVLPVAALAWVGLLGAVTFRQTSLWRNTFGIVGHSITVSGANARLVSLLGAAHLEAGRSEAAIPLFEKSLKEDNANSAVAMNLALAYAQVGRIQAAIHLAEQVAAAEPDNYAALRNLSFFYREAGDEAKARDYERRANAVTPRPGTYFPVQGSSLKPPHQQP